MKNRWSWSTITTTISALANNSSVWARILLIFWVFFLGSNSPPVWNPPVLSIFFILMNDMWQRSNLTIRKTPTQSLYFSNLLSLTSPLLSANYRHHLSMRDPSMEALFNTRFQMKSNPANQIQYLSLL